MIFWKSLIDGERTKALFLTKISIEILVKEYKEYAVFLCLSMATSNDYSNVGVDYHSFMDLLFNLLIAVRKHKSLGAFLRKMSY